MTTREYDITGSSLDPQATLAKARKLADRVVKKGLSGGYTLTVDTRFVGGIDDDGDEYGEERHFLVVSGKPAAIDGWRFVAMVEWVNGNAIVATHPDFSGTAVDRTSLIQGACDHCGVQRNRKRQVVVENVQTGERKVVGSACLKDFLGHIFTPAMFIDPFADHFDNLGFGAGIIHLPAETVLTAASRIIRQFGFVTRTQAEESFQQSSADLVNTLLTRQGNAHNELVRQLNSADADDTANTEAVITWVTEQPADSDWMMNLQAVLSADDQGRRWVAPKHNALVTSAMGVWLRKQADTARTALPVAEEFVGTTGEKVEFADAIVVAERNIENQWGISTIYTLIADERRFDWITSGRTTLTVGEKGHLKGTVKSHRDWETRDGQARKTTILTRCKFASEKQD